MGRINSEQKIEQKIEQKKIEQTIVVLGKNNVFIPKI